MTIENEYIDKNTKEVVGKRLNVYIQILLLLER